MRNDDDLDSVELVPNIILNPGFCESDDQHQLPSPLITKQVIYDDYDDDSDDYESRSFKQKLCYFFTGDSIKPL